MPGPELIGREPERAILTSAMTSPEAELIAVYGRRRVGKTFLVRQFLLRDLSFVLTGVKGATLREQLSNFAVALGDVRSDRTAPAPPTSWAQAFAMLREHLMSLPRRRGRRKQVLFFDELPWLAARRSRFLPAFDHFWNSWAAQRSDLVVVLCGSAAAWMIRRILHARGGLHNRVTRRIRLEPFDLAETARFLSARRVELGVYQTLELYMALGGIPHYLKEVERGRSAASNIDRICFGGGILRDEFSKIYASLFEQHERHERVVRALASKRSGLSRTELLAIAGHASGGTSTNLLEELEESGFVMRTWHFGRQSHDTLYRLADEYSLFYLKWIERHRGRATNVWTNKRSGPQWRSWSGYAFETICLKHVDQLKRRLGIEAVETEESAWRYVDPSGEQPGAQIDLLIDRRDDCINLCEMKFSGGEFVIDRRYARELRHKRETLRRVSGTRKAVLITIVTTYGVADNVHSQELVDASVDARALFARPD